MMSHSRSVCVALVAIVAALGCARGDGQIIGPSDVPVQGEAYDNDAFVTPDKPVVEDIVVPPDEPVAEDVVTPPEDIVTPPEDIVTPPDVPVTPDVPTPPEDLGPTCGTDQALCGGTCVSVQSDNANCGRCSNACAVGTLCVRGACASVCADGQTACPASGGTVRCANLQSDGANCGACGTTCPSGQTCSAGRCASTCPTGQTMCAGGSCADLNGDSSNCGRCGNVCSMGQRCSSGVCSCPTSQTLCGFACVTTATDLANCGRCGNACGPGLSCSGGACACPAGQTLCAGACVDAQTDVANCGRCANRCVSGQQCRAGACACPAGQTLCAGRCVDTATDEANCGACASACAAAQTCTAGRCACPTGQSLCGTRCVNLQSDNANCGACGTACPATNSCAAGRCTCSCATGLSCCGTACINLQTSATNCGMCGRVCASGTTCRTGSCAPNNDALASATTLTLTAAELTVTSSTVGATFDGPTTCTGTAPNVWYRFTLTGREVVYADTAGSAYDTRLYLVDSAGAVVTGTCNDDASCSTGGFTSTLQSRFSAVLSAGTYSIAVSGFGASSTGAFTLHVQHIPSTYGSFFYATPITGTMNAFSTSLIGTSARTPTCAAGASGEDMRWFMSCGAAPASLFSLCQSDGGTFVRASGTTTYDPTLYVYAGRTGTQVQCNDDGGSTYNCQGTGGDTLNFGPRISAPMERGVSAVLVDERLRANGLNYTLHYQIN